MFKIGDFSKLCRVPTSMLRYYADIGLLEPAHTDKFTGYRYYTADQLHRLNRILALRDLGLSLDQIKTMLDEALSPEEIRGMLRLRQAEIQVQIADDEARLRRVAARLRQIEQENQMPTLEVVLKTIETQHVMSIREVIPTPDSVGTLLGETFGAIMGSGINPVGAPVAVFHDQEFKPADMDVEIAIPVAGAVNTSLSLGVGREIVARDLPAIPTAACVIHSGSYDEFENTYAVIGQWIADNGYRVAGPSREVYLTEPDSPSGPITEIQWPVEKAG